MIKCGICDYCRVGCCFVGESTWRDWVLVALAGLPSGRAESERAVMEEVAVCFADRFGPTDRVYDADRPRWHDEVRQALVALRSEGLVQGQDAPGLTEPGRDQADRTREPVERAGAAATEQSTGEQASADDEDTRCSPLV